MESLRHITGFEHLTIGIHSNQANALQLFRSHPIDRINATVSHPHHEDASRRAVLNVLLLFSHLLDQGRFTDYDFARADDMFHGALKAVEFPLTVLFLKFGINRDVQLIVVQRDRSEISGKTSAQDPVVNRAEDVTPRLPDSFLCAFEFCVVHHSHTPIAIL